jgi:serine/threonine protein kinase
MAPEIILMVNPMPRRQLIGDPDPVAGAPAGPLPRPKTDVAQAKGFTSAVDWWSLGVTVFKLLCGYRPFDDSQVRNFIHLSGTLEDLMQENPNYNEYTKLFRKVQYPDDLSAEAVDFISKLLDVNQHTRLGAGKQGLKNIKKHPFFASIDWNLLEQKHMVPPFKPDPSDLCSAEKNIGMGYPDLPTMMGAYGKSTWLEELPPDDYQKYFASW